MVMCRRKASAVIKSIIICIILKEMMGIGIKVETFKVDPLKFTEPTFQCKRAKVNSKK